MSGHLKSIEAQQFYVQIATDFDLIFQICLMDFSSLTVSKVHSSTLEIVFFN